MRIHGRTKRQVAAMFAEEKPFLQALPVGAVPPLPVRRPGGASGWLRIFASWLRTLFRQEWVVYAKRSFGGHQHALRYLGAYTHRVAISNHRLNALEEGNITFRWRDSAHGNKKKLMRLPVDEVPAALSAASAPAGLRTHPPLRLLRTNRRCASLLPICFQLLGLSSERAPTAKSVSPTPQSFTWRCPCCGGTTRIVERISEAELLLRSPPQNLSRAA
jgi:putative transposase